MSITTYLLVLGWLSSTEAKADAWTTSQHFNLGLNGKNSLRDDCAGRCNEKNDDFCDPTWLPALNLNGALTGIDIAKKHPMPFSPEDDPSVKKRIFESVHRNEIYGNFEPYKYIDVQPSLICSSEFESKAWMTTEAYIHGSSTSSMSGWSVGYEGPTISGEIGLPGDIGDITVSMPPNTGSYGQDKTETSDAMEQFFSSERGSISHSEARCSIYSVDIYLGEDLTFHSNFIESIKKIDKAKTEDDKKSVMETFIDDFGSHYASRSTMGVGVIFETRYTEEETMNNEEQTRNDCSSQSGGLSLFGFSAGGDHTKCKGSLNDTTHGENTSVKRFTSISYGTLPVADSLSQWTTMVNSMMEAGTLSPLPTQQELRLILDLFGTPQVADITHDDGTKVNVTNLFLTALDGYGRYCSRTVPGTQEPYCNVPTCARTVLAKGLENGKGMLFTQQRGLSANGRPTYKNAENLYLYLSNTEGWIISENLSNGRKKYKSSPCPQKGVRFQEIDLVPTFPDPIDDWKECSKMCFGNLECKFWQLENKTCSLIKDYEVTQITSADVTTGTQDCPGDKSLLAYGQCVETMSSRSMWQPEGSSSFEKGIIMEAFDPTFLIIAGGVIEGNELSNTMETFFGNKYCTIPPNLPEETDRGTVFLTAEDHQMLYCGQELDKAHASTQCYAYDKSSRKWKKHSTLPGYPYWNNITITMPDGVYMLGGDGNGPGWTHFLPKSSDTWQKGPDVPPFSYDLCGVKISDNEFVIIGRKQVNTYNVQTGSWTERPDLIEDRRYHSCTFHPALNKNGSIIITGGRNSKLSTEIIPLHTWTSSKAGDLKQERYSHRMVTVGGTHPRVYAIGGDKDGSVDSPNLSSVEVWDDVNMEWKMAPFSLGIGRSSFTALAIPPSTVCLDF